MEAENKHDHRRSVEIVGPLGFLMLVNQNYTWDEAQTLFRQGESVPLDLMPAEYWRLDGVPRFDEQALGSDF